MTMPRNPPPTHVAPWHSHRAGNHTPPKDDSPQRTQPMNILSLSTSDLAGGAERVAWTLFNAYRARGHASTLVVGTKRSADQDVVAIPPRRLAPWNRPLWSLYFRTADLQPRVPALAPLRRLLGYIPGGPVMARGHEDFDFPASRACLEQITPPPDIVHAHNLHGGYFDLTYLPALSRRLPVVLTLHDEWLLTGHCAYSFACTRWQHGCGHCPDLTIYPALAHDGTAYNWQRKAAIYAQSRLYIATPSLWLMDHVQRSMLRPAAARVIPNGIDLGVYHPADRRAARLALGLPPDRTILLFVASGAPTNPFKDYTTIAHAVARVAAALPEAAKSGLLFIALGGHANSESVQDGITIRHIPFQSDPTQVARYYQAADLFLHAARADNFPNTLLEAQACGTPVIATAVGGIPETLADGVTGLLVPPADSAAMAQRICDLLADAPRRAAMSHAAAAHARAHFDLNRQVDDYLTWYVDILAEYAAPSRP